jgi:hypothetical protein
MNERIRELVKQATECYSNGQERTFDKEKFAELIVRECIRLCDEVDLAGADDCIDNIRDHFGVEE